MHYKTVVSILLLFFSLISCSKKEVHLNFESTNKTEKDFGCEMDCPEINIQQLVAKSATAEGNRVAKIINNQVSEHIIYSLSSYSDSIINIATVEDAAKHFILAYQKDKLAYPDMVAHYKASIESERTHDSKNLLSIRIFTHLYTGGAHGYSSVSYLNFDPKTGHILAIEQMLIDVEDFISFVEIKFRRAYGIPETSDINSTKFMFEGNAFILASSIGFDDKNMVFTYNPYEIAPYSEGPIELKIPINEVQAFLNITLH